MVCLSFWNLDREGLEVKVRENLSDEPPLKVLPQLAGQMLIWDLTSIVYAELRSQDLWSELTRVLT